MKYLFGQKTLIFISTPAPRMKIDPEFSLSYILINIKLLLLQAKIIDKEIF